jgi:membrane-bound serine protease (ClpP class)
MILALILGVLGLFCLYFEFFLPGGILALLGGLILLGSMILFGLQSDSTLLTTLYVLFFAMASICTCLFALKSIRLSGRSDSFFLQNSQEGFSVDKIEENLVGKEGVVTTELKPAGHVRIEKKVVQALSCGPFISKGEIVEVIEMRGACVIVKCKT